jgi:hypothetical protein
VVVILSVADAGAGLQVRDQRAEVIRGDAAGLDFGPRRTGSFLFVSVTTSIAVSELIQSALCEGIPPAWRKNWIHGTTSLVRSAAISRKARVAAANRGELKML